MSIEEKEKIINNTTNLYPANLNTNININVDATESLNKITGEVLNTTTKPIKKASNIVTNLISFIDESIDTGLYIYKENLEYHKRKCRAKIQKKIEEIPKENVTQPDIGIIGETIENLKYNLDKDYIVELYSSIIARNVDNRTNKEVLPSFISIIKDLSYDDIQLLEAIYKYQETKNAIGIPIIQLTIISEDPAMNKDFKNAKYYISLNNYHFNKDTFDTSLENLVRLRLIDEDYTEWFHNEISYNELIKEANLVYKPTFSNLEMVFNCECNVGIRKKGIIKLSNTGYQLMKICLFGI